MSTALAAFKRENSKFVFAKNKSACLCRRASSRCPSNLPMKSFKNAPPVPRSFGPGRTLAEHLYKMNNPSTQTSQSSEMMTFIYALSCPLTGATVYVGKANNPNKRLNSHLSKPCSISMRKWIVSLPVNSKPVIKILETCALNVWEHKEKYWIAHFRALGPLLNVCDGGNGFGTHTAETRAAFGAKHKGKKISIQHRMRLSALNRGKKLSPESIQKMRDRKVSPETRAKLSAANIGKKLTPEHREKLRGRKWSAEQMEKARARRHTPETRAKMSAAQKGRRLTPEHIAKMRGRKLSPETLAKLSIAHKGAKLSEEHKYKLSVALRGRKIPPEVLIKRWVIRRAKAAEKLASKPNQGTFKFQNEHICT